MSRDRRNRAPLTDRARHWQASAARVARRRLYLNSRRPARAVGRLGLGLQIGQRARGRDRRARASAGSPPRRARARLRRATTAGPRPGAACGLRRRAARPRLRASCSSAARARCAAPAAAASRLAASSPVDHLARVAPSSASGTFHWNASSRPLTGDTGIQRSETKPSAVQAGSRGARSARAIHSRARPSSPLSRCSISAISAAARCVGSLSSGCERRARGRELLRVERRARHRQRALGVAGRLQRQRLHPREPLARGVARAQMRVGVGEVGMRIGLPRPSR